MRVCVYCGSTFGNSEAYRAAADRLGRLLADHGLGVVYGGGGPGVGMMGTVAEAALQAGGEVIGVIPRALVDRELAHRGLSELRVVADMHERKALMAELADAFVVLPGGIGTLEELFEVWTWAHLGLHRKPVTVLDVDGFYAPLWDLTSRLTGEGFLPETSRELLRVATDPAHLVAELAGARPALDVLAWATVRDGRMLAARTRGSDAFYLPGGKREPGEADAAALSREVKEETGTRLNPASIAPFTVVSAAAHGYPDGTRVRLAVFTAEGEGEPTADGEITELAWLPYEQRERCAPGVRVVMDRLQARGLL